MLAGDEAAQRRVVAQLASGLAEQVHCRIPAAAQHQSVTRNCLGGADLHPVEVGDHRVCDAIGAAGAGHHRARAHRDAPSVALATQRVGHLLAGIDDGLDLHTRISEVERGRVGAVVCGEHHPRVSDQHSVAVQEGFRAMCQHDSRPVVIGEHDRALVRTGRHHHVAGSDPPHPLAGQPGRGGVAEMVGTPLEGKYEAIVIVAECGGALQVSHLGVGGQFGDDSPHPFGRGGTVDLVGAAEQRATCLGLLVDHDHPGAGTRCGQRRRQPRGSGADDEHVGVRVHGVVAGGVRDVGEATLAGEAAGGEAVVQFDRRGQQHRLRERRLDLNQPAGILGPRRRDSPWAAEFDARRDLVQAVSEQRRREGVTGVAGESTSVEGEFKTSAAVDATADRGAVRRGHEIAGFGSPMRYTPWN